MNTSSSADGISENGVIVDTPCKACHGTGRERVTRRYQVKVPAGAKDGVEKGALVPVVVGDRAGPGLGHDDVPPVGIKAGRDLLGGEVRRYRRVRA